LIVATFFPGLDGVMPPLFGADGASLAGVVAIDTVGSFLWSAFYVGLGYVFSNQLEIAIAWAQHFAVALAIAIGVPVALYASLRGLTMARMIRQPRLRRISPAMIARKLKSKSKVAVLDLLDFEGEADNESPAAIPGAFRVDPSLLRESPYITVPHDIDIVLYSSSGSDAISARAAMSLKRIGVDKVWVLEGGLKAWREQGFPVSPSLEAPELVAERLGVKFPKPQQSEALHQHSRAQSIQPG
jgi:rhodanese-related sulfurtransferase